jgi:hypothetical protein
VSVVTLNAVLPNVVAPFRTEAGAEADRYSSSPDAADVVLFLDCGQLSPDVQSPGKRSAKTRNGME